MSAAPVQQVGHPVGVRLRRSSGPSRGGQLRAVDMAAEGRAVVERIRASRRPETTYGALESIEMVQVGEGERMDQFPEHGLRMTWRQDDAAFGLLMSMGRLVAQSGSVESIEFYLRLAIDEPHSPAPDGSRLWFLDLPSGVSWTPHSEDGTRDRRAAAIHDVREGRPRWWNEDRRPDYFHPVFMLPGLFLASVWTPVWGTIMADAAMPTWLRFAGVPALILGLVLLTTLIRWYIRLGRR